MEASVRRQLQETWDAARKLAFHRKPNSSGGLRNFCRDFVPCRQWGHAVNPKTA